ncbi:hypothetical protein E2320_015093 [Naja naja]|nr:hypothetical protein E2320_015093 [Naja naja]
MSFSSFAVEYQCFSWKLLWDNILAKEELHAGEKFAHCLKGLDMPPRLLKHI